MNELNIDTMYQDHTNNDPQDHPFHHHEPHRHEAHNEIPPNSTGNPPQLNESISSHTCRSACQCRQNIGEGGDSGGGGGDADGNGPAICSQLMPHVISHDDEYDDDDEWVDVASETDSLKHDEGISRHEVERPRYELHGHWIAVDGRPTKLRDIFIALAQHRDCSCHRRMGILPSPDRFTSALNSPMHHSGMYSASPTESMIAEAGSGWQSMSPSMVFSRVISTPSLVGHMGGGLDAAFPPLPNFLAGPLYMGEEHMMRRGRRFHFSSPPEEDDDFE